MFVIKILATLWPFLKEWFLGPMSVREALIKNKKGLITVGGFSLLLGLNIFTIPRLYSVTGDYLVMKKEYAILQTKCVPLPTESNNSPSSEFISNSNTPNTTTKPTIIPDVVSNSSTSYPPPSAPIVAESSVRNHGKTGGKPVVIIPKESKPKKPSNNVDRYESTKNRFEKLRELESTNTD